jgi:hypothetical protein
MHVRFVTIAAAAAIALETSAAAEPPKAPAPQSASTQPHPAPVVLASADHVTTPDANQAPAKPHRVPRVTTCRCGGDPQPDQPEDQQ